MTPTYPRHSGFGLFFGPESFSVGIVGHKGFPESVSVPGIDPLALPGVSSTTRTKVVSEVLPSASIAPYPGVTAGDLLGAR
jgi:hypothetical protein